MARIIVYRLTQGVAVIAAVFTVVFFALRVVTTPADVLLPVSASEETRQQLSHQLGLDRPLIEQFMTFLRDALHFDFGDSYKRHTPAMPIIIDRFGATLQLVVTAMVLAVVFGMGIGAIAAMRPRGLFDRITTFLSIVAVSVPQFWLGLMLILLFSVQLQWLPSSGMGGWDHVILPALTIAIPAGARFAVVTRQSLEKQMKRDYIRMDVARGYPRRKMVRHAMRNTTVEVWAVIGFETIYTLAGHSLITEVVFAWPGIGLAAFQALESRDLPVVQASVCFIAVLIVVLNLIFDLIYFGLDPRVARKGAAAS